MIKNESFDGERPLYRQSDITLENCVFTDGESPVKEGEKINSINCDFNSKYPFWHCKDVEIHNGLFREGARAAIWYTHNVSLKDSKVDAPKIFRDASNITIEHSILNTDETLWDCNGIKIFNAEFTGDYLLFHSSNVELERFKLDGKYSMQHVKNMVIRNSTIKSKDAFWNTENVTVYDSIIEGEYLGWYSHNLKLINCTIIGTQPLCYASNLLLENCEMIDTDLSFELSEVKADITTRIKSVKNPKSGIINTPGIDELIMEESIVDSSNTDIIITEEINSIA